MAHNICLYYWFWTLTSKNSLSHFWKRKHKCGERILIFLHLYFWLNSQPLKNTSMPVYSYPSCRHLPSQDGPLNLFPPDFSSLLFMWRHLPVSHFSELWFHDLNQVAKSWTRLSDWNELNWTEWVLSERLI